MSTETRLNFTPNLVVGIAILLLGIVLTLDRLSLVAAQNVLRYWPVLLILFGGSVAWQAFRGDTGTDGIRRERPIINAGVVIWVAVAAMLFPQMQRRVGITRGESSSETVTVFSLMGRDDRVSTAAPFRGAEITTMMGHSVLDLRQATMAPGESAVVDAFVMMGEAVVHVPKGWVVDSQAVGVMGRVSDRRSREERDRDISTLSGAANAGSPGTPAPAPPRIVLRGSVMMGALVIRS